MRATANEGVVTFAQLTFLVDALRDDDLRARWQAREPLVSELLSSLTPGQRIARLAAEGTWILRALGGYDLDATDHEELVAQLEAMSKQTDRG